MAEPEHPRGPKAVPASRPDWGAGSGPSVAGPPGGPEWHRPDPGPATPVGFREPPDRVEPAPPPARRRAAVATAGLLAAALVAGLIGGKLGGGAGDETSGQPQPATSPPGAVNPFGGAGGGAGIAPSNLVALYRQVAPSVVQVVVSGRIGQSEGTGSGVIVDEIGSILTNYHVVSSGQIRVVLADGTTLPATLSGSDPERDLAVIRLVEVPQGLVGARLGDSATLRVGDPVVAIGAPFGLQNSMSAGIVSGLDRVYRGSAEYPPLRGLIQTDAAINPGNSGGPLLNMAGEVVGINTAIESPVRGSVGVGFAVPINGAGGVLPSLISGLTVTRPSLGVHVRPVPGGAEVTVLEPGGTSIAVLQVGDVIVSLAGEPTASMEAIRSELNRHRVGETVEMIVLRGGRVLIVTVTLQAERR